MTTLYTDVDIACNIKIAYVAKHTDPSNAYPHVIMHSSISRLIIIYSVYSDVTIWTLLYDRLQTCYDIYLNG